MNANFVSLPISCPAFIAACCLPWQWSDGAVMVALSGDTPCSGNSGVHADGVMTSLFGDRPVMEMDSVVGLPGTMADDALTLSSPLLTEVDVEASGLDIDLALDGSAGTDISVTATAEATGIYGLAGADAISTHALLEVSSETQATSESVTLNLADFENANASVSAISNSHGVQGGEGADTILNHNTVRVGASSFSANPLVGDNLDVTVFDVAGGTVTSSAFSHATAVALDGGADDDLIRNFGTTEASAQADALRYVSSVGIIGNPSSESMVDAQALATAIFGGQGKDHRRRLWSGGDDRAGKRHRHPRGRRSQRDHQRGDAPRSGHRKRNGHLGSRGRLGG